MEGTTWYGWGDRGRRGLPAAARRFLTAEIGLPARHTPPVPEPAVRLPDPALPPAARAALAASVGPTHVRDDRAERLWHAGGKSYLDLVRRRAGDAGAAPDAVVLPGNHEEVLSVLRICAAHRVAVVPFGGGTSVVGGVEPERGRCAAVIALDLRRLDRLVDVDRLSLTARFEAGARGPHAEAALAAHGLTLGHFPQSFELATLGGFAATRSAGQASAGYGRFADLVAGLRLATPRGTVELGRGPASAAGPDLRELVLGSEGTLGVITELTLRVRPAPEARRYEGWSFPCLAAGLAGLRRLAQEGYGALPDVARLSDPAETRASLVLAGGLGSRALRTYLGLRGRAPGCLMIAGWEGPARLVRSRRAAAARSLRGEGGMPLVAVGRSWERDRFAAPYLRDDLLDAGALVETVETAASWSSLPELYDAVRVALVDALAAQGTPPLVLCHVSHVYADGASLYFTVIATRRDDDPEGQWLAAKRAASEAIVARRATITHHHAVGRDHRPWLAAEVGDLGVEALRAVKERLDPAGILNPGALLPLAGGDEQPSASATG